MNSGEKWQSFERHIDAFQIETFKLKISKSVAFLGDFSCLNTICGGIESRLVIL